MKSAGHILRDNIWQFMGFVAAVVAVLVTIISLLLQREVKSLQVVLLANSSVVEVEESISADIEVLYKDMPIGNLSFVQIKLENNGNQTIREEDFAGPINLVFPSGSEILDAGVLESDPPNIGMTLEWEQSTASLSPVMLNGGDGVIVELLLLNMPSGTGIGDISLDVRVAGVKDIPFTSAIARDEARKGWFEQHSTSILVAIIAGIMSVLLTMPLIALAEALAGSLGSVIKEALGEATDREEREEQDKGDRTPS